MTQPQLFQRCHPLKTRWERQIAARYRGRRVISNPLATLSYLASSEPVRGLIEVRHLLLLLVHYQPTPRGVSAIRMAGFSGHPVRWGICWGGSEGRRLEKNLRMMPARGGRGLRPDLRREHLLARGLQLEQALQDHALAGYREAASTFRLPLVWAAFTPKEAAGITGDGPELELACRRFDQSPEALMARARRSQGELGLFPLDWVSHVAERAVALLADLNSFPRQQVFELSDRAANLKGFRGACEFDFTVDLTSRDRE